MGYAKIIGGGPNGRYTIELDFGKAARDATLFVLGLRLTDNEIAIGKTQALIDEAEALVQPKRDAYAAAVDDYIAAATNFRLHGVLPAGSTGLDTKVLDVLAADIRKAELAIGPLRRQLDAQKFAQQQLRQEVARWNDIVAVSTRDAWCTTLTEDAPIGSYAATCDIPGDSNLVLLAPNCRAWKKGDGTITPAQQLAIVGGLTTKLNSLQAQMTATVDELTSEVAAEATFQLALDEASAAYAADPSTANRAAVSSATAALAKKQSTIATIRGRLSTTSLQYAATQKQIATWSAKATSTTPVIGDGLLTARAVMSPEQAFWCAAVQPGWQKYMPTYRWGTATSIDYNANTMDVALFDQRSDAQRLPVNQSSALTAVPVEYMTCNAGAFSTGDRVVVQFQGLDWNKPKVIGFLDNPKSCGWPCVYLSSTSNYIFASPRHDASAALFAGLPTVEVKIDGGSWTEVPEYSNDPGRLRWWELRVPLEPPYGTGTRLVCQVWLMQAGNYFSGDLVSAADVIDLTQAPSWPPPPEIRPPEYVPPALQIYEYRIILGGKTVFNVAVQDTGWDPPPAPIGAARTNGGITYPRVLPLAYDLTG